MAYAPYAAAWRELAYRAIRLVGDAIKDTSWGQPTFGPDYEEELLEIASAIEARSDATPKSGAAEGESAVPDRADAQPLTGDTDA